MTIKLGQMLSISEANENFPKATHIADHEGSAIIVKDNKPRYMLVDLAQNPILDLTEEEKMDIIAKRILEQHREAFEELAK